MLWLTCRQQRTRNITAELKMVSNTTRNSHKIQPHTQARLAQHDYFLRYSRRHRRDDAETLTEPAPRKWGDTTVGLLNPVEYTCGKDFEEKDCGRYRCGDTAIKNCVMEFCAENGCNKGSPRGEWTVFWISVRSWSWYIFVMILLLILLITVCGIIIYVFGQVAFHAKTWARSSSSSSTVSSYMPL